MHTAHTYIHTLYTQYINTYTTQIVHTYIHYTHTQYIHTYIHYTHSTYIHTLHTHSTYIRTYTTHTQYIHTYTTHTQYTYIHYTHSTYIQIFTLCMELPTPVHQSVCTVEYTCTVRRCTSARLKFVLFERPTVPTSSYYLTFDASLATTAGFGLCSPLVDFSMRHS